MTQTAPPQLATALRELTRLIKAVQYYPAGHPALKSAAGDTRNAFLPLLESGDSLVCTVRKEGFFLADTAVDKNNQVLKKLAAFLFSRLVQHLLVLPDLTVADLLAFGRALTTDPAEIRNAGGIKEILLRQQVTTIWVNETDLKSILQRKQEIETARAAGTGGEGEEGPDEAAGGGDLPDEKRSLQEVLAQLRQTRDEQQFRGLLEELVPLALRHRTPEDRLLLLEALALLCRLVTDRDQEQVRREFALHALQQICDVETIDFLIAFLCEPQLPDKHRQLLVSILAFLKQRSTPRLMDHLARETDAGIRKQLAAVLIRQGPQAVPTLLEYIRDERWYVVRNTATILGEIRDPGTARHLNELLHHEDTRVCREAIRALTRIGGSGAVQVLLEAVDDEDGEVSRQALLSLGVIGDASAVPKLSRIIRKADFFLKHKGRTRDAIRALGEIGSPEAVPVLSRVLRRRRLFKRRSYDELRVTAAQALGEIGDPASIPPLETATRDRSATVARQAGLSLKRIQREDEPGTA
ncbi:HEAT repeat domain-containing protein [Geothermobacter hydrogeniphilus]|uniref:HEAT repeat n=1 Tax=Geothermobacter hydrogeniphilus TaxID=1969733 RepID=A0A1X0XXN4_9BACT|nr:HEAT repeat domain-containing protein [Geothermobacter hydrogeniphilus]ORJ57680.1 hypothetical protein B5V00_12990 [Geothermobacter hydrogeniphilus]